MLQHRWRRTVAAVLLAGLAAVAAGCGQPSAAPDAPPGAESPLTWEARDPAQLPEQARRWVEEHRTQQGIWQATFGDETLILVAWGEKPTGGYSVEVVDVTMPTADRLRLVVRLREPGAGDAVTQVITYPAALVAVRPAGTYQLDVHFEGATFYKNSAFEILEPAPFTVVSDRLRLRGKARVFEATFMVRVEDGHNVLAEQPVMASEGAPGWGDFDVEIPLQEMPTSPHGVVHVFEASAKDGSPLHALVIPITFQRWGE